MQRRKFTQEFKLEAVRLIREGGVSFAQARQDLGVHESQRPSYEVIVDHVEQRAAWFYAENRVE